MEIIFTTTIIEVNKISASRIRVGEELDEYRKEINSSGCVLMREEEGYMNIISNIEGRSSRNIMFMVSEGMGMLGVIATKYENRTNIPLM